MDANISDVARRNGVARGLLTAWRRRLATAADGEIPSFLPVTIDAGAISHGTAGELDHLSSVRTTLLEQASPGAKPSGAIEIEVSEARIRVEPGVADAGE